MSSNDDLLTNDDHLLQASAPPSAPSSSDEQNGFIVVPQTSSTTEPSAPEIAETLLTNRAVINTVFAEADSSSSNTVKVSKPSQDSSSKAKESSNKSSGCTLCPYYMLACNYASKVQVSPQVKDLLLWTNPKLTGAVFGSLFVLLLSFSLFSLLTVVSSLLLLALTVIGSYRFYLAVLFRIKGVQDQTFDKLAQFDVSLPKDKVKQLADLLETDINKSLNQLKSILLWDNVVQSSVAFGVLYAVYCVGCIFNTLTLVILTLVSFFTLPKVYQVYKKEIDQALQKVTTSVHLVVKQAMEKIPFLNKKKSQ